MYDIQDTLGVKSMSDLTIKTIKDIFKTKTLTIEQIRNNKRYGKEFIDDLTGTYIHEDLILSVHNSVLGYRINFHFPNHRLGIEVDEKGHKDRNEYKKVQRENAIKELGFIKINPDEKDFDMYDEIGKIYNHINRSSEKLFNKSLTDRISKILVELEIKSNHLMKSVYLKYAVKKILLSL